jgi:hypothetical protein
VVSAQVRTAAWSSRQARGRRAALPSTAVTVTDTTARARTRTARHRSVDRKKATILERLHERSQGPRDLKNMGRRGFIASPIISDIIDK